MQNNCQLANLQLKGPGEDRLECAHLTEQEVYGYLIFQWHVYECTTSNAIMFFIWLWDQASSSTTRTTMNPILSFQFPTSLYSLTNFRLLSVSAFRQLLLYHSIPLIWLLLQSFLHFCALILHVWWFIVDPITYIL